MNISLWLSGFWVFALFLGKVCLIALWLFCNCETISGTLSQFTRPSSGICPGDNVRYTCVVNTTAFTIWRVNSGGVEDSCTYSQNSLLNTETCGPGGRFTSSVTDVNGDPSNSSLSANSITSDLSGTSVTCSDGNAVIIGSSSICVIGKMKCHEKRLVLTKQCCVANVVPRPFHAHN